jgi:hypothetical protein
LGKVAVTISTLHDIADVNYGQLKLRAYWILFVFGGELKNVENILFLAMYTAKGRKIKSLNGKKLFLAASKATNIVYVL